VRVCTARCLFGHPLCGRARIRYARCSSLLPLLKLHDRRALHFPRPYCLDRKREETSLAWWYVQFLRASVFRCCPETRQAGTPAASSVARSPQACTTLSSSTASNRVRNLTLSRRLVILPCLPGMPSRSSGIRTSTAFGRLS